MWVYLGLVVCVATYADGSALRCTPGVDEACETEQIDKDIPVLPLPPPVPKRGNNEAECLAGTEWESNCHFCRCSDDGAAHCIQQETCEKGEYREPIRCKPQSTFKRDCNTCFCLDNGFGMCTLKGCGRSSNSKKSDLLPGDECSPGSKWTSQCNECYCSPDGKSTCTEKACPGQENERVLGCAPDTAWKKDCNTCWCTSEGRAMCTRIGCLGPIITDFNPNRETTDFPDNKDTDEPDLDLGDYDEYIDLPEETHNILKRSPCKPNARFESDCNYCKCSSDGQSFTCTHNECIDQGEGDQEEVNKEVEVFMESEGNDHVERHSVCKPRGTFNIGCNTCNCNHDGTDYTCTNKPCPLPEDVEIFHELRSSKSTENSTKAVVCAANRMFIKDCNTCWCNEDGTSYFCTRKVCVPELPEENAEEKPEDLRVIIRECRPDEVFELDCNMCRCNPDGKSFSCTRRACVPEEEINVKNASLTRKVRATAQQNSGLEPIALPLSQYLKQEAPKTCQPGQEFRMDCNKCLCDNEGLTYSCTRIDCNNNNNGGTRSKRDVPDPSNDCSSSDGLDSTNSRCQEKTHEEVNNIDSDPSFRCNPGEQYKQDCNDCTCSADGRSVFCTIRLCDQNMTPVI